jgi:hypothetical protein
MISLLTPFRSKAGQAKTSLFLAKVYMSFVSSVFDRLPPMVTFLFATDFVSSWSLRPILPFSMFGGSGELLLATSIELMLHCDL